MFVCVNLIFISGDSRVTFMCHKHCYMLLVVHSGAVEGRVRVLFRSSVLSLYDFQHASLFYEL